MKNNIKWGFLLILFLSLTNISKAQEKKHQYKLTTIAFYNLENLFDTIVDPDTNKILQDDFTPDGPHHWDSKKYYQKLDNMSKVIRLLGTDLAGTPPMVVGVSEVENENVLIDLVNTKNLKEYNYGIVHYESPDRRGIDVALLYRKDFIKIKHSENVPLKANFRTRSQLVVEAELDGETLYFIVNHWPSRRGGEKRSSPRREAAAALARSLADSILNIHTNAKIILMGDLNDQPTNKSVKKVFNTSGDIKNVKNGQFYNTMEHFYKKGVGTGAWRDTWSLFDQLIISPSFLEKDRTHWVFYKSYIFNRPFLINPEGRFKGYPLRSFVGNTWQGGYSDHFPVYLYLIKEKK